jgi:hypothetical protein
MGICKETAKSKGSKLLLDAFQYIGMDKRNRISERNDVVKLKSN